MVDVYTGIHEESRVPFDAEKINALLGTSLTKEEMLSCLDMVELRYDEKTNEIVAPTFRQDICGLPMWQRRLRVSTATIIFRQRFPAARRRQENCRSSFA